MRSLVHDLESQIVLPHYAGWDPYDGLNAPSLRALTFNRKWLRIAVIQAMKRSPVNFRSLFGVPKGRNPKAFGLLVRAYLLRYKQTGDASYLERTRNLLDWLIENSSPGYSGFAWGYNFDWQSSVFFIPKGVPTVVNTAFIANAFVDAYEVLKEKSYLDVARSSCDFIMTDLRKTHQHEAENLTSIIQNPKRSFCYSYSPSDDSCCHNANLLAAELLARVCSFTRDNELCDMALNAAEFTVSRQNQDGSWYYGLSPSQRFIDSFHTGFVLVSLNNLINYLDAADENGFRGMLRRGYEYYKRSFWENDGCPRYYNDRKYPIDLHCSAQGIITFLRFREEDSEALGMARRIAQWATENMWDDRKKYFYFQKTKFFTNKIRYLRWPNAWMYYALSMMESFK